MAVAQRTAPDRRYGFWATGLILFALWNLGSLAGALIGSGIDTSALGLDAAAPAIFMACCGRTCPGPGGPAVALRAAAVALVLVGLVPAGVPVIAAAGAASRGRGPGRPPSLRWSHGRAR